MLNTNKRNKFINILDYHSAAEAELNFQTDGKEQDENFNYKLTNKANVFSDCGAWHGFYLPGFQNNSFFGPLIIDQEIPFNAGQYFSNFTFLIDGIIQVPKSQKTYSVPGELIIEQNYNCFSVTKELIMVDGRNSLVRTYINNKTSDILDLAITVNGIAYQEIKYSSKQDKNDWKSILKAVAPKKNSIQFNYNSLVNAKIPENFTLHFDRPISNFKLEKNGNKHRYSFAFNNLKIDGNKMIAVYESQSFDFMDTSEATVNLKNADAYFNENGKRWDKYLTNLETYIDPKYMNLAVKCTQTLIANWRSPAGEMLHDFFVPSIDYTDFIGAWSWDTWKFAVGISLFDSDLAKNCILAMFDHQISAKDELRPQDVGMIPDCVFFNKHAERLGAGNNWNERNTKSSIAAWSVLRVYEIDHDLSFLKKIYPKIKAYNQWWNSNRSYERNNILQFGATVDKLNKWEDKKTIIEAAAWESGMDNAPRFDWEQTDALKVFNDKKELVGYVIDQASVDLNAFNYLELISLAKIAELLQLPEEAKEFTMKAKKIKAWINTYCYDEQQKCYFDVKIKDRKLVNKQGKADECMVCLFANAADSDKALAVIKQLSADNYLTYVCFPSVSKDSPKFDPTNYWRGPVWLDQWYFALKGLCNYDHHSMAKKLLVESLEHMKGLLKDKCIMENYNPLDGTGLATTNFSWSASMLLMGLKDIYSK